MDLVITPQPHLIPGYTGHCPQLGFRDGKTYGKLTHKLFIGPCITHAPKLIIERMKKQPKTIEYPTPKEIKAMIAREKFVDASYRYPLIPGYEGYIPNLSTKIGKRFVAAATAGMVEHEALLEQLRCDRRHLMHRDLLESGNGLFEHKVGERLMPKTTYRAPLTPVQSRAHAIHMVDCSYKEKKEPYSKFTVPHFMEDDDEEKYIIHGYSGHVPMAMTGFGHSSKQLTNSALRKFTNNYHNRRNAEWCPAELPDVASDSIRSGDFVIYHRTTGIIPNYGGHVPGSNFLFGRTFGDTTVDAKRWLDLNRD